MKKKRRKKERKSCGGGGGGDGRVEWEDTDCIYVYAFERGGAREIKEARAVLRVEHTYYLFSNCFMTFLTLSSFFCGLLLEIARCCSYKL